ncbi:hypothetical protein ACH4NC_07515 [Streptomyces sp. NPDC017201]|uniref:hypothetical protein n=1 Tax=Streptomyces sp. NPDC017201 TaxID=3364980 RepID=UPI00378DC2B0
MSRRTGRKAAQEQDRLDRRAQVDNLLARYARTSPTEAEHLRALLDVERAEGDQHRREAGGQQAATHREQQRRAAAEQALAEQARAHAEQLALRTRTVNVWAQDAREARQEQQRVEAVLARVREQLATAEAALAKRQQ